jgi:hypothetical protein
LEEFHIFHYSTFSYSHFKISLAPNAAQTNGVKRHSRVIKKPNIGSQFYVSAILADKTCPNPDKCALAQEMQ